MAKVFVCPTNLPLIFLLLNCPSSPPGLKLEESIFFSDRVIVLGDLDLGPLIAVMSTISDRACR